MGPQWAVSWGTCTLTGCPLMLVSLGSLTCPSPPMTSGTYHAQGASPHVVLYYSIPCNLIPSYTITYNLILCYAIPSALYQSITCYAIPSDATSQRCISMESPFFISVFQFFGIVICYLTQYCYISSYHIFISLLLI